MASRFEFGCKHCARITSQHMVTVDGRPAVYCTACGTCNFAREAVRAADKRAERTFSR